MKKLALILAILAYVAPVWGIEIEEDAAATVLIGPFSDPSTGAYEVALVLRDDDIQLSKNGGAFGVKNDTTDPVHMGEGMFSCVLNATDTSTAGSLVINVIDPNVYFASTDPNALFTAPYISVVTNNWYGSKYGTDELDTSMVQLGGSATGVTNMTEMYITDWATGYDGTNNMLNVDTERYNGVATPTTTAQLVSDPIANGAIELAATEYSLISDKVWVDDVNGVALGKVPKSDSTISWNATALAAIEAEALDALEGVQLDHLVGVTTGVAADGDLSTHIVDGSALSHLMTAGADTSDYKASTEALEALRNRGDASWVTYGGGSTFPGVSYEITSVDADQVTFVITSGPSVADMLKDQTIVLYDHTTSDVDLSVRTIVSYAADGTVKIDKAPYFTLGTDDSVTIDVTSPLIPKIKKDI